MHHMTGTITIFAGVKGLPDPRSALLPRTLGLHLVQFSLRGFAEGILTDG